MIYIILTLLISTIPFFIGMYKWHLANEYMLAQKLSDWDKIEKLFVQFDFKTSEHLPTPLQLYISGCKFNILLQHYMSLIPINPKEIPEIHLKSTYPPKECSFDEVFLNAKGIKDIRETYTNC